MVTCSSPAWEEDACPSCSNPVADVLAGFVSGHTGSPYLRVDSTQVPTEIGVGDIIKLAAATVGTGAKSTYLTQYFEVKAIEACGTLPANAPVVVGCTCGGTWEQQPYIVTRTFNGTGYPNQPVNSGFEIITGPSAAQSNCALYEYDKLTGGAGDANSPLPHAMWPSYGGGSCTPVCNGGAWGTGTKITLSEPVYKIPGTANVAFSGLKAYRARKSSCTSCKCSGGCTVTVSVTNDGKKYSGSGASGSVWTGSALSFSLKDIVPTVMYIDHDRSTGLAGYRDSTRIFGPASGGTSIEVYGENFQDSSLLRCYFAGVQTMVKAEYVSSTKILCKTPAFFARQLDASTTLSDEMGAAALPHTKVHVTNDGMLGDIESEGTASGHISQNPYLMDDGSTAYIHTFAAANTYESGMTGFYTNPFRSTCQEGLYPNEGMKPCWGSHHSAMVTPDGVTGYSAGNDVLFKYAVCYDANPALVATGLDLYTGTTQGNHPVTSTATLGQTITITNTETGADDTDGPLTYMELHLEKASEAQSIIEVSISTGAMNTPTIISTETITVSKIVPTGATYYYKVFFNTPAYLLAGSTYNVQLKWVSGAEDVRWFYTNAAGAGAYTANTNTAMPTQRFKLKGYTCDGCRTKYKFTPAVEGNTLRFGTWVGPTQENGGSTYLTTANPYRSMLAQEFRPSETGTITHAYLKLQNVNDNGIAQSYVSIWITQYGKYGEYVCNAFGGFGGASPAATHLHLSTVEAICDSDRDGVFDDACSLGAVCDPNSASLNGGCGGHGSCALAETVVNAHRLRPESGGSAGPCGPSEKCSVTMSLAPDHRKIVKGLVSNTWVEFEFLTPVPVSKHTTYFLNAAVVGNIDISKEVIWASGAAPGDGGAAVRDAVAMAWKDANNPSDELRFAYVRSPSTYTWSVAQNKVLAVKLTRCVSSTAQVLSFKTEGEKTGCCSARASPQGGNKGAKITITGLNFFPSDDLRCVFHDETGATAKIVPGTVTNSDYTEMTCPAPEMDPHTSRDCTNPALCRGTTLVVTNDGFTVGPQYMGPKWYTTGNAASQPDGTPAYLGLNPLKFLFSDIYASPTGSDTVGDGTLARPYQTIQRAVDAANEYDQIVLLQGYYTGLGNRGLRHHGKKLNLQAYDADRQNTVIDCQHAPDGFILNNNKDSDSPFAGYIDTKDIITRNCENLRIYDI